MENHYAPFEIWMWYPYMWVFQVDVCIVRCQKCPWSLSLSFRPSLQVLSPSVLLHRMGLLTFESFLVAFFVDTFCYPCSLQHHGSYIAYVNVFCHLQEMLSSWFMYDVYCDTITGKYVPWMFVSYLYALIKLPRFAYSVFELSHLQGVEDEHWHLTVLCVWQLRARPNNGTSEPERCMVQQTAK